MNIKLTPFAKLFIISITIVLFVDSCSCKTCGVNSNVIEVPEIIFSEANKLIIDKVGREFFEQYIHADYLTSKKKKDKYEVRYNFKMLDYNFVDEEILIVTDSTGKLFAGSQLKGIPFCTMDENGCVFIVDKERAIEIGVENSLPEGIKEWAVEFRWSVVVGRYIWHVVSTTREFGEGNNYKASGEEIMINPVSGEVLKRRNWNII